MFLPVLLVLPGWFPNLAPKQGPETLLTRPEPLRHRVGILSVLRRCRMRRGAGLTGRAVDRTPGHPRACPDIS